MTFLEHVGIAALIAAGGILWIIVADVARTQQRWKLTQPLQDLEDQKKFFLFAMHLPWELTKLAAKSAWNWWNKK